MTKSFIFIFIVIILDWGKCITAATSVIWQQPVHTTEQLLSPDIAQQEVLKNLLEKKKKSKNGPLAETGENKMSKRTQKKNRRDRKAEQNETQL